MDFVTPQKVDLLGHIGSVSVITAMTERNDEM